MSRSFGPPLQGVSKKPKTIEIDVLFEFQCPSTKLIPRVHKRWT